MDAKHTRKKSQIINTQASSRHLIVMLEEIDLVEWDQRTKAVTASLWDRELSGEKGEEKPNLSQYWRVRASHSLKTLRDT